MIAGSILLVLLWTQPLLRAGTTFSGKRALVEEDVLRWTKKDYLDQMLPRIKAAGFNVLIPYVWHGRGTSWLSDKAPWDTWLNSIPKDGFDPIAYMIQKAHALGMEVHPCFTVSLRQADIVPEYAPEGTPPEAFDVHHPQFRIWIADLVEEVVKKYDVDGINLDFVRTQGVCASAWCRQEYAQLYNRDLVSDLVVYKIWPGGRPTVAEYQEKAVTDTIKGISDRVRAVKPKAAISVDAIPGVATPDQGQNSIDWANKGYIDVLFRMDYYRSIDTSLTDALRSQLRNPDALSLMISNVSNFEEMAPGQAHFARDGKWLAETVAMIQAKWPKTGVAIYFANYLTEEQIAALKTGPFRGLDAPANLRIQTP